MEPGIKVIEAVDIFKFIFELSLPLCRSQQLHVLRQISEWLWWGITSLIEGVESDMIQLNVLVRARIVGEDPWENWVL